MRVKGEGESRENTGQVYKVGRRSGEVHTRIYGKEGSTKPLNLSTGRAEMTAWRHARKLWEGKRGS